MGGWKLELLEQNVSRLSSNLTGYGIISLYLFYGE